MSALSTRLQNLQNTIDIYSYNIKSIVETIIAYQSHLAKKIPTTLENAIINWFPVPTKPVILRNNISSDIYDEFIKRNGNKFSEDEVAIFIDSAHIDPFLIARLNQLNRFSYRFNYLYTCLMAKFWTNANFDDNYWEELYHLFCYEFSVKDRLVLIPSLGLTGNNVLSPFIEGISSKQLSAINDGSIKNYMYIGQNKETMIIAPETSYKLFMCVFGEKTLKSLIKIYYTDNSPINIDIYKCIPISEQLNKLWINMTNLNILTDKLNSIIEEKKINYQICINSVVIGKNFGSNINVTIKQSCGGKTLDELTSKEQQAIEDELVSNKSSSNEIATTN